MATPPTVELNCSFKVVSYVALNPFGWALLRTLRAFPHGTRPDFDELSIKLCVGNSAFFGQAWCELADMQEIPLISDPNYQSATITLQGEQACEQGFVAQSKPSTRQETLYFFLRDGDIVKWKSHFKVTPKGSIKKPHWAEILSPENIADAILHQIEDPSLHIRENQRILEMSIDWSQAQEVRLD